MAHQDVRQRKQGAGVGAGEPSPAGATGSADRRHGWHDEDISPDAGWMVLLKVLLFVVLAFPLLLVLMFILVVPSPIKPVSYTLPSPPKLEGPFAANDKLVQKASRLYEGQLVGPESIIYQHGHLYAGTSDGKILHMEKGKIEVVTTLGTPPCGTFEDEPNCGRPLGMRFDSDGYLIVADAYLGLYKVNVATGDSFQMVSSTTQVDGKSLTFLNDLDISSEGEIYFTESSIYHRKEFPLDILDGACTGRLLRHDPRTNSTDVVLDLLCFANGVQLSRNQDYILVAESTRFRILKYHLKGPKSGQRESFVDNLPAVPDNIRLSSSGGYWLASSMCRHADRTNLVDILSHWPWLRKQIAKIPVHYLESMVHRCSMLLEFSKEGQVRQCLQDLDGVKLPHPSEVHDDAGILYVGSYKSPFIGKVDTRRAL